MRKVLFSSPHTAANVGRGHLFGRGCDPDARNPKGRTVLMKAAAAGTIKVVTLLVAAGANVFLQDSTGKTALDWARKSRQEDVVSVLEAAGVRALKKQVGVATGRTVCPSP
jgi:ankyrin repeat protein